MSYIKRDGEDVSCINLLQNSRFRGIKGYNSYKFGQVDKKAERFILISEK
jgi:hypothetical protein